MSQIYTKTAYIVTCVTFKPLPIILPSLRLVDCPTLIDKKFVEGHSCALRNLQTFISITRFE